MIEAALERAERDAQLAEVQIARALGYKLCECTSPPQIMLSIGYIGTQERFRCSQCEKVWPPQGPKPTRTYYRPRRI